MGVKFTNNASTTLTSAVSINDTSISVNSSAGFPDISSTGYFYATVDSEVLKVTAVSGTTWTIDAATVTHNNNSTIELRVTAEVLEDVRTETTYTAGTNVAISGSNVISSTDTTYTASGLVAIDGSNNITTTANNYTHPSVGHLPSSVSQTEAGYLDGVTSSIQTQMDTKASTGKAIAMAMVFG